jgi:cyclic lactone autoinducer peptide
MIKNMIEYHQRRFKTMKNEKIVSNKVKKGIKSCLLVALKSNANSSGCFFIYLPKAPKELDRFKKIK